MFVVVLVNVPLSSIKITALFSGEAFAERNVPLMMMFCEPSVVFGVVCAVRLSSFGAYELKWFGVKLRMLLLQVIFVHDGFVVALHTAFDAKMVLIVVV